MWPFSCMKKTAQLCRSTGGSVGQQAWETPLALFYLSADFLVRSSQNSRANTVLLLLPMHSVCLLLRQDTQSPIRAPALADGVHFEADILEQLVVQDPTAVEEEGGFQHAFVKLGVWIMLELIPLGEHDERVRSLNRLLSRFGEDELVFIDLHFLVPELC